MKIPKELKGRLVIGDSDQIKALKIYEKDLEEKDKLKNYDCRITYSSEYIVNIEAYDEDEAKQMALEEMKNDLTIEDYDFVTVIIKEKREIK